MIKKVLWIATLLSSCASFDEQGQLRKQLGGIVAYERWPDGHVKYAGDFTQSFAAATQSIQNIFTALVGAYFTNDLLKVRELTSQLATAGANKVQITQITTAAQTQALSLKLAAAKAAIP